MIKVRVVFEKKGRAKYISHLDLNRCMQRTFKRSGIPVWYTEGFNPHIYIMFALPLTLGYESSVEIMDFNLTEEIPFNEITERLNKVMPDGLKVLKAFSPVNKHTMINYASYKIKFISYTPDILKNKFDLFMSQEHINVVKKTKRSGEKIIDLKPDVKVLNTCIYDNIFEVELILPAGNVKNFNPSLIIEPFMQNNTEIHTVDVERTGIFMENINQVFK